jgi:predicted RNA-binding protein with EMAP domain
MEIKHIREVFYGTIHKKKFMEELKELRKEVTAIRYALIPEEEVSEEEFKEMEKEERVKLEDTLEEL